MKITKKRSILLAAIMLVTVLTAAIVFAQPSQQGVGKGYMKSFIGQGFALNGNEYHVLDVNARFGNQTASGHIRFAGQSYALKVTAHDNQSLAGDVMTLPPAGANRTTFTPATVGHISLSISKYEGERLSTGTLTMNNTNYNVLMTSYQMAWGKHMPGGRVISHAIGRTFMPRGLQKMNLELE